MNNLEEAIEFLKNDQRFRLILTEFVGRREDAIADLGEYETLTELRKAAAEVKVYTDVLNMFSIPTGEPMVKTPPVNAT